MPDGAGHAALVGLISGAVAATLTVSWLAWRKRDQIERTVAEAAQAVMADASARSDLAERAVATRDEIMSNAIPYAEGIAERTARDYLSTTYGLTPTRIARLQELERRFA